MATPADTVESFLAQLPDTRRPLVESLRATILDHLPDGFVETLEYGMLAYAVPLERFPDTYNGRPLMVLALANQKRYVSLYLMGVYGDPTERDWFVEAWTSTGKKLNMGKSCVRFTRLDAVPLDVVGEAAARVTVDDLVAAHERAHRR